MKTIPILACVILVGLTGCETVRKGASAGLGLGALAAPEYAGVLKQIQRVIEKEQPSPVDGFDFDIVYRYRGTIVDAKDITWEERFIRIGSADKGLPPIRSSAPRAVDDTPEDARLRAEISAILDAAGIGE